MTTIPLISAIAELLRPVKGSAADASLLAGLSFDTVLDGANVGNPQPETAPFLVSEYSTPLDKQLEALQRSAEQNGLPQVLSPEELAKKAVAVIAPETPVALPAAASTTPVEELALPVRTDAVQKPATPAELPELSENANILPLPAAASDNAKGEGKPFTENLIDATAKPSAPVANDTSALVVQDTVDRPLSTVAENVQSTTPAATQTQAGEKATQQPVPATALVTEAPVADKKAPESIIPVVAVALRQAAPVAKPEQPVSAEVANDETIALDSQPVAKEKPSQPAPKADAGNAPSDRLAKAAEVVQASAAPAHAKVPAKASEKATPATQLFAVQQPVQAPEETATKFAATKPTLEIPAAKPETLPANQPLPTQAPAPNVASTDATTSKPFAETLETAQTATPVEQVIARVKTIARPGSTHVRVQLDPAELGHVEMKIHVSHDGKTNMVVTAEHKHTLEILQRDTRGLEQLLSDSGLKADSGSLSFHLRGEQQQQQNQQNFASGSTPKVKLADAEPTTPEIVTEHVVTARSGVDIRV